MSFKLKGFDQLEKQLKQMQRGAKELEKTKTIPFDKLFNNSFMSKYTNFSSFDEFLDAGNFIVNSQRDFELIPDSEMDIHVNNSTKFSTWEDMLSSATEIYISQKLGL